MAKKRRGNGQGTLFQRTERGLWIAAWFDHNGKRQTRSTGTSDKAAATRILQKNVADAALRRDGVVDANAEAIEVQARRPIGEHLADWQTAMQAKGISDKRVMDTYNRALRIVEDCKYSMLADVDAAAVQRFIGTLRDNDLAPRTINGYLQAFGQFINWARDSRRLAGDPLAGVKAVKVIGQTFERRPLLADELASLIGTAEAGPVMYGATGQQRAMLYRVAVGTGFRASELASLTPSSFDLKADPPTVTVKAAYSKRRRNDQQPIRPDLADMLRPWLAVIPIDTPALKVPARTAEIVRADLRKARAQWIRQTPDRAARRERRRSSYLSVEDDAGRVVDFHALRVTYITMIVKGGASVRVCQELARHSDPKLTMNVYTRLGVHDLTGALDGLPNTKTDDDSQRHVLRATGTDDAAARSSRDSSSSANVSNSTRRSATDDQPDRQRVSERNPLRYAEKRDVARRDDAPDGNTPGRIRTCDLCFRKALLYPAELRGRCSAILFYLAAAGCR